MDSLTPQRSLLRQRSFVLFWCARTSTSGAYQMQAVAVGWQLYDLTHDPLDLGLVGLMQFFPVVVLALVIGQTADHFDRRAIAGTCQVVKAICAALFALGTLQGWLDRSSILTLILITGTARAFEAPTLHAIVPGIVPRPLLPRAIAASATAQQTAIICGPALGGFLYVLGPAVVYGLCTAVFITACILISFVQGRHRAEQRKPVSVKTLFAGFAYIRDNPILLGAISLDLFAVLLGGVTALLPIYARDILGTGPWGLGLLRSAPAVGALSMSVFLARHAIERRAGILMLGTVCIFGMASTVFALSTWIALSFAALIVYGAADAISRGDPPVAGADAHAPRHAGPRHVGQFDVLGLLGHARRIPRRRAGRLDRRGAVGVDRRRRRRFDRAGVVPAVPGAARHRAVDRRDRRALRGGSRHGGMTQFDWPLNLLC